MNARSDPPATAQLGSRFRHESRQIAPQGILLLLTQAVRRRQARLDRRLAPEGLNLLRYQVLAIIRRMPGCAMSALACHAAADRTTLTRNVDQLAAQGLVERRANPRDRRQVRLDLTPRGQSALERAGQIVAQEDARLFEALAPGDAGALAHGLEPMVAALAGEEAAEVIALARETGGAA
jgi:DNA-binding MarR family transcriptional regulator